MELINRGFKLRVDDVAGNVWQAALPDGIEGGRGRHLQQLHRSAGPGARQVLPAASSACIMNPRFSSCVASYDVAGNIARPSQGLTRRPRFSSTARCWRLSEWPGLGGGCGECVRVHRHTVRTRAAPPPRRPRRPPRTAAAAAPRRRTTRAQTRAPVCSWRANRTLGPGRCCSPRHRLPFNSGNEGSKCAEWRGE